jgi:hypothetical protein
MSVASAAKHGITLKTQAPIFLVINIFLLNGVGKVRPSIPHVVLISASKKR